ncbi:MAG: helix-hairpin-helix domain-containing protein [Ruminococcus sp.]|nr:helix-hairpin-helix domain-containing protein [Ruminococcus sp.]
MTRGVAVLKNDKNHKTPEIKAGAIVVITLMIVAMALIFMSLIVRDETDDKNYETKTTPPQTANTTLKTTMVEVKFPLDLNKATFEQLLQIDGVGEDIAGKIISYRNEIGHFSTVYQLLEISGIGEKRYEMLMKYLYVSGGISTTTHTTTPKPETTIKTTTKKLTATTSKSTTKTTTATATTTTGLVRKTVNINTASIEEIMNGLLVTYEEAKAIVTLRENIGHFRNPLEVLYATDEKGREIFSDSDYNKFKDVITIE